LFEVWCASLFLREHCVQRLPSVVRWSEQRQAEQEHLTFGTRRSSQCKVGPQLTIHMRLTLAVVCCL
jgi:hypothetical protein